MTEIRRFPITLRKLTVLAVEDIAPRLRKISLGGPELSAFTNEAGTQGEFISLGPDDHVKIFFPDAVSNILTLPTQETGRLRWPRDPSAISREYTPRLYDPESGKLDLEFVLHDHGIAEQWAAETKVGDQIHIAGPKASMLMPVAARAILFGDETAIPAIANWLAMRPASMHIKAFIFSDDPDMQQLLRQAENVELNWLEQAPDTAEAFIDLIKPLALSADDFLWGACERSSADALRSAVKSLDLPSERCDISNYWTRGQISEE